MNIADDLVKAFNDGYAQGKADAENYAQHCGDTDKPFTNADRIRMMTDEELAEEILSWYNWLNAVEWDDKRIINWLKQEAEE